MPLDLQQFRTMFENKLEELMNSKNVNSCYISKENYARIINRLEYIINVEGIVQYPTQIICNGECHWLFCKLANKLVTICKLTASYVNLQTD
jgi:hypothetical protein